METIEIKEERGNKDDAGYLRLEYSAARGEYYTDIIQVRKEFRRQGIAESLLEAARSQLGYYPAPAVILPNPAARAFWSRYGWEGGFNTEEQAKYDA